MRIVCRYLLKKISVGDEECEAGRDFPWLWLSWILITAIMLFNIIEWKYRISRWTGSEWKAIIYKESLHADLESPWPGPRMQLKINFPGMMFWRSFAACSEIPPERLVHAAVYFATIGNRGTFMSLASELLMKLIYDPKINIIHRFTFSLFPHPVTRQSSVFICFTIYFPRK